MENTSLTFCGVSKQKAPLKKNYNSNSIAKKFKRQEIKKIIIKILPICFNTLHMDYFYYTFNLQYVIVFVCVNNNVIGWQVSQLKKYTIILIIISQELNNLFLVMNAIDYEFTFTPWYNLVCAYVVYTLIVSIQLSLSYTAAIYIVIQAQRMIMHARFHFQLINCYKIVQYIFVSINYLKKLFIINWKYNDQLH